MYLAEEDPLIKSFKISKPTFLPIKPSSIVVFQQIWKICIIKLLLTMMSNYCSRDNLDTTSSTTVTLHTMECFLTTLHIKSVHEQSFSTQLQVVSVWLVHKHKPSGCWWELWWFTDHHVDLHVVDCNVAGGRDDKLEGKSVEFHVVVTSKVLDEYFNH